MLHTDYAKALADTLETGTPIDTVLARLDAVLAARGHEGLRARILRSLETELTARASGEVASVTVATATDAKKLAADISTVLNEMGVTDTMTTSEDTSLIGGFVVRHKGRQLDRSYKSALLRLYRNITA